MNEMGVGNGTGICGKYILDQNPDEVNRLNMQHQVLQAGFGHKNTLDLPVDLFKTGGISILDIATGSGAWISDVARIPEIASRLSPTSINRVKLFGCDILDAKFPPQKADSFEINFFKQDVTKPFPQAMRKGWQLALVNIENLLKPGGRLLIMEYNVGAQLSMKDYGNDDINSYFQTESSIVNRVNAIMTYGAKHNDFVWGFFARFPSLLESTSMAIVSMAVFDNPVGVICKDQLAREYGIKNLFMFLETISRFLLSQNCLEIPRGHKILTEMERGQALKELFFDVGKEGFFNHLVEWIVQKPL